MTTSGRSPEPPPPPADGVDLQDHTVAIDLLDRAAEANLQAAGRRGAVVDLPATGRLLVSGDLHDHGLNFMRLLRLARLHRDEGHHVILHELIHGPHRVNGMDLSIRTLMRVAALKIQYPKQVHLLLANHELSQLNGDEILKDGVSVVKAFDEGVGYIYGDRAGDVSAAMAGFVRSMLLAVRCPNGIMCSHSLPSPRMLDAFDTTVLDRVPNDDDLRSRGAAHTMVWGRNQDQAVADALGQSWDTRLFVMGHQPAEMGYFALGESMLVIASDHNHGQGLPIDLSRRYQRDDLIRELVPLASVVASTDA